MTRLASCLLLALLALPCRADPKVVEDWCDALGKRLFSVSADACRSHAFVAAPERTPRGNALVHLDIEAAPAGEASAPAKRVLIVGGIHGDELTAVSSVFGWLEWIGEADAAPYRWRIIPSANPDGLLVRPSTRVNANGVDLNRNFETPDWERDARKYWIHRTGRDPRRNPGTAAGSEIETRWLQDQIEAFKPDLIISLHAPYNLLDYDGPVPQPLRFGRLALNRLGVYPGSMGNYCGLHKQIPVITIELPSATSMPSQRDQLAIWQDMLKWMKQYIASTEPAQATTVPTGDSAPMAPDKPGETDRIETAQAETPPPAPEPSPPD